MTAQDIRALPTEEKLQIMETLWEDMRARFDASETSIEILALLRERKARVARGDAKLLDWDCAKLTIGRG